MLEDDSPFSPIDYVAQQLATIHDRRLHRYLEREQYDYEVIVQRLRVLAFRRPSLLQRLLGVDNSVGATNALLVMDPDGISQTIEVYVVRPPENS